MIVTSTRLLTLAATESVPIVIWQDGNLIAKTFIGHPGGIDVIFHEIVIHEFGPCYGQGHVGRTADIAAEPDLQCRIFLHVFASSCSKASILSGKTSRPVIHKIDLLG